MSDLFQEGVPTEFIGEVGCIMQAASWHTYQVLTKRHGRMHKLLRGELSWLGRLPHVWFGVSVENRRLGLLRIEALRETPAALRFLSIEPLLEDLGPIDLRGIDWVIVGGESGPGAHPMKEEWVLSIRERCRAARVPFFFKQWGGVRKELNGRRPQGRTYDDVPNLTRLASSGSRKTASKAPRTSPIPT